MSEQKIVQWWAGKPGVMPNWQQLQHWLGQQPTGTATCCFAMQPGSLVFASEPILQMQVAATCDVGPITEALAQTKLDCQLRLDKGLMQVYRQLDDQGRFAQDVVQPLDADPIAGLVLLQPTWRDGRWVAPAMDEQAIAGLTHRQRQAMPAQDVDLPVVTGM